MKSIGSATLYGRLLITTLALITAMLELASLDRSWFTPACKHSIADVDHAAAIGALRRSWGAETTCIVITLGTLAPHRRFERIPPTARKFR